MILTRVGRSHRKGLHSGRKAARLSCFARGSNARLNPPIGKFTVIVGNPPFGTDVSEGDDEQLGQNSLSNFKVAAGMAKIDSEQVLLERSIDLLEPGGRLGLIVPDGLLNNQGDRSNCPRTRSFIASRGRITALISLPDHAFRKSGAQNKTSILFFQKFTVAEQRLFDRSINRLVRAGEDRIGAMGVAIREARLCYRTFLGEAVDVGYTPAGAPSSRNDLYHSDGDNILAEDQAGSILGEWRRFASTPDAYSGHVAPDCAALSFEEIWESHGSHRLDPKYHLFKYYGSPIVPDGWIVRRLGDVLQRREERATFSNAIDELFTVMTIGQTGDIRAREAGKGRNPPEWRAEYFKESPGTWYVAHDGDVVFSSIDLWKGCIALVPSEFDGALVSNEFPIYSVIDSRLEPAFLQVLLRSRYYQRAFRAITTGHSNRRRTQVQDFEELEIAYPLNSDEQHRLISNVVIAKQGQQRAQSDLQEALMEFDNFIDGRGGEEST